MCMCDEAARQRGDVEKPIEKVRGCGSRVTFSRSSTSRHGDSTATNEGVNDNTEWYLRVGGRARVPGCRDVASN